MSILWLEQPTARQVNLVGGKAANLARLAAAFPVPPGFVITDRLLDPAALVAAYHELGRRLGQPEPSVAVRSSAIDEDGATTSFAGQHETYLNITGADAVAEAVVRCWKSAHSERALDYRRQNGLATHNIHLAVLVQALVPADVSAVVFSANPVNQRRDEIVVTASWGLGESVVGGTVTPDTFVVKADSRRQRVAQILSRQIADKQWMTVATPEGTEEVRVPALLRDMAALSDTETLAMAQLALDLQAALGYPVDVECVYANGQLYLLQCRPITTLAAPSPVASMRTTLRTALKVWLGEKAAPALAA